MLRDREVHPKARLREDEVASDLTDDISTGLLEGRRRILAGDVPESPTRRQIVTTMGCLRDGGSDETAF